MSGSFICHIKALMVLSPAKYLLWMHLSFTSFGKLFLPDSDRTEASRPDPWMSLNRAKWLWNELYSAPSSYIPLSVCFLSTHHRNVAHTIFHYKSVLTQVKEGCNLNLKRSPPPPKSHALGLVTSLLLHGTDERSWVIGDTPLYKGFGLVGIPFSGILRLNPFFSLFSTKWPWGQQSFFIMNSCYESPVLA